ncbi:MAG: hypothetical protein ACI9CF_001320 [Candidatus Omnitrophota bacterium]|jgi:hypothetical protein
MKQDTFSESVECPQCGYDIELSEAVSKDMEKKLKSKFLIEKKTLEAKLKKDLEAQETAWETRLEDEKTQITSKLQSKIRKEIKSELKELESEVQRQEKLLETARKDELDLRRQKKEIEERERNLELDIAKRLEDESKVTYEKALTEFNAKHRLDIADKEKQLTATLQQVDELKRKLEQKSQQAQGEVLELELEDFLRKEFPFDDIQPVAKGVRGGDIVQIVKTQSGNPCGQILWETKRTKTWSDSWIRKLKDDCREAKADIAVIVSQSLPKGFHHFRQIDGVWVTDIPSAISLALALRLVLVKVSKARQHESGKRDKMELVYEYMTGNEFRHRVEAIVEAFRTMRDELDFEKQAIQRIWAKREKQIENVVSNTIGLYGDLEGIAGPAMPNIPALDLPLDTQDK